MANENLWKNGKNSETQSSQKKGSSDSRYVDAKELAEQAKYDARYHRIHLLIEDESLDFRKVADRARLKERKVRDTLLFRLTSGDMIQLFGHKEGICYICGLRIRGKCQKEPLCLTCLEIIDEAIQELYTPPPSEEPEPIVAEEEPAPNIAEPAPPAELTLKEQYEKLLAEVTQYRTQYGPLEPEQPDKTQLAAQNLEDKSDSTVSKAELPDALSDILDLDDDDEDLLLSTDEASEKESSKPLQHFGFQRINSRN